MRALYHLAVVRRRRMIDDERDRRTRILVGARLNRVTAARYNGRSVYRFVPTRFGENCFILKQDVIRCDCQLMCGRGQGQNACSVSGEERD